MKIKDLQELASRLHDLNTKESEITEIRIKPTPESLYELEEELNSDEWIGSWVSTYENMAAVDLRIMFIGITFIITKP